MKSQVTKDVSASTLSVGSARKLLGADMASLGDDEVESIVSLLEFIAKEFIYSSVQSS